ncbi:MAG: acyclic terpene utilization AtuA family protein, partial [Bacteroidia bacterium]|nr:DUF1446 domain-containing protein [Bacteroidia bacterium]MDW8334966.1 acyclic terpene utilization AtuA family protein [Bacteroidia bacterium]
MEPTVRIGAGQGFYGDSPMSAIAMAHAGAVDFIVHDALAELTLSILQKDRLRDPSLGYARDIELHAKLLYPPGLKNGVRFVTNSGGLNPQSAAAKVAEILAKQGLKGVKIAAIWGDDMLSRLDELVAAGETLENLDTGAPYEKDRHPVTHANVYIGGRAVAEALDAGAQIILAGRVADPCLTLGILVHHYRWNWDGDWDLLAAGVGVGHLLECGGQASGGNSYAHWPPDYNLARLAYPIALVRSDGTALFTRMTAMGGKISRDTLREQLVYEIHDPARYFTPDVVADFTSVSLVETGADQVEFSGAKGAPPPQKLKLCIGRMEGYLSDQFFFFSRPYAYQKALKFIEAVKEIWSALPVKLDRCEFSLVGV